MLKKSDVIVENAFLGEFLVGRVTLCVVGTGSDAVRGGAERPEPAAGFRAGGSGVDAGEESDHQGSHGPVVASVGAGGKAQQAGFLQGVCILCVETDAFLFCFGEQ